MSNQEQDARQVQEFEKWCDENWIFIDDKGNAREIWQASRQTALKEIKRLREALNRIADPEDNENTQWIALEALRAESV